MARDQEKYSHVLSFVDKHATNPDAAKKTVGLLFPKVSKTLNEFWFTEEPDVHEQRKDFRLSNKDFASSYFRLHPGKIGWKKQELESIFLDESPASALQKVENKIEAAAPRDKFFLRRTILEQLGSAFETRRAVFNQQWLSAIVLYSPVYIRAPDEEQEMMFSLDFMTRLEFVVLSGLKQLSRAKRVMTFRKSVSDATDISLLCSMFRTIAGDAHQSGDNEQQKEVDFGKATKRLRALLVEKVTVLAVEGTIWNQADPDRIIWFWWGANFEKEVFEFTNRAMRDPLGLRMLLESSISRVRSTEGNYDRVPHAFNKIVDVAQLENRAQQLAAHSPIKSDRQLAERFLSALKRRD